MLAMERIRPNQEQVKQAAKLMAEKLWSEFEYSQEFHFSDFMYSSFLCGIEWTDDDMICFFQELKQLKQAHELRK